MALEFPQSSNENRDKELSKTGLNSLDFHPLKKLALGQNHSLLVHS